MSVTEGRWLAALALLLAGWWLPRAAAGTRWRFSPALFMDALLPVALFTTILVLSARPLLAGVVTLAAGAGWARADRDKRRVLAEPIVFTDVFQAFDTLRHPQLAMPFPNKAPLVLAALATIGFFALVIWLEPAAWPITFWPPALLVASAVVATRLGRTLLPRVYDDFRQQLTADPTRDSAAHGPLATILLYGLFARSERQARRAPLAPTATVAVDPDSDCGPVVLVQNESFFDARRLHSGIPAGLLPAFDRACRDSLQWGRFAVPSFGANTVRTEFAVLTGLSEPQLGFDRFNPYYRFADQAIQSLAWTLRQQGYKTICLHPFDRHFYRRDLVMPNLGFDLFLGEEQFNEAVRINGYVSDVDVAQVAARLIREHGPKLFLFVITMENHGPWGGAPDPQIGALDTLPLNEEERLGLNHYFASLVHADQMIDILRSALEMQGAPAVLGFYGDHLPSFPSVFPKLGLTTAHSDYFLWRSGEGGGVQRELAAADLAAAVLRARR